MVKFKLSAKLTFVVFGALLAFVAPASAQGGGKSATLEHLEGLQGERFEAAFLKQMTHHHGSGIEMAKLAEEKSKRREVRELAEKIDSSQAKESKQMTSWLKEWFDQSPEPHFRDEAMEAKMRAQMEKLRAAEGDEFDRLFLEAMSDHHRSGVQSAKLVPEKSSREELEEAAKKMVDQQSEEIEQMTSWRGRWFGK